MMNFIGFERVVPANKLCWNKNESSNDSRTFFPTPFHSPMPSMNSPVDMYLDVTFLPVTLKSGSSPSKAIRDYSNKHFFAIYFSNFLII